MYLIIGVVAVAVACCPLLVSSFSVRINLSSCLSYTWSPSCSCSHHTSQHIYSFTMLINNWSKQTDKNPKRIGQNNTNNHPYPRPSHHLITLSFYTETSILTQSTEVKWTEHFATKYKNIVAISLTNSPIGNININNIIVIHIRAFSLTKLVSDVSLCDFIVRANNSKRSFYEVFLSFFLC